MTERPILFSAPMVRAILAGTKTQTRRVVKPQPPSNCVRPMAYEGTWTWEYMRHGVHLGRDCPYGVPGDLLWVREAFTVDDIRYLSGPLTEAASRVIDRANIYYRADGECCAQIPECQCSEVGKVRWRPSIHMPRWASRITLRVTSVRVERVQDISEEDARAEGCVGFSDRVPSHRESFMDLWWSINGEASWQANPWVWVVGFERVEVAA